MAKVEVYRQILKKLANWDQCLVDESRLPGPRANLELVEAVAAEGDIDRFQRYLTYDEDQAPYGSALEFLPLCGVVGLGRLLAEGQTELLAVLRRQASDPRWRIREGVALALQKFGDKNMAGLLEAMEEWSRGNLLERRAVAVAICEPRLLQKPADTKKVLILLDQITSDLIHEHDRRSADFKVLRKALGYCWSVAVVAEPDMGKRLLEKWCVSDYPDIRWIIKENLKKNRLRILDPTWVERWEQAMISKELPTMPLEDHAEFLDKMGISPVQDEAWHKQPGHPKVAVQNQLVVDPFVIGGSFVNFCVEQGWLFIQGTGRQIKYVATEEGRQHLLEFGIKI